MPHRPNRRRALPAAVCCALLLAFGAACSGGGDEEPALDPSSSPTRRTVDPSPPPSGEERTLRLAQGAQDRSSDLELSLSRVTDGEARLTVSAGPDIDEPQTLTGSEGDALELENGYTITLDKVEDPPEDHEGVGNAGSVTLTVTPPE
ncbi:hypothetical protein J0910_24635 [Nocardiopsis sp. CNT-189]|uniref:hypothetical protein n=1 Tax=Nocardiopsis oceanisediminis TaxID=2816862 RepID=UPI003B36221D